MKFGEYGFAVACGDSVVDAEGKKTEFRGFGLDETYLWSEDQFVAVLAEHPLEILETIKT